MELILWRRAGAEQRALTGTQAEWQIKKGAIRRLEYGGEEEDGRVAARAVISPDFLRSRPAEADPRELVISRGKSGYLALYRYDGERDRVLVLAIRHQREAGYLGFS